MDLAGLLAQFLERALGANPVWVLVAGLALRELRRFTTQLALEWRGLRGEVKDLKELLVFLAEEKRT